MKYRSKPVDVQAIQIIGDDWLEKMKQAWGEPFERIVTVSRLYGITELATPKGPVRVYYRYWISRTSSGGFKIFADEDFKNKFDRIENDK